MDMSEAQAWAVIVGTVFAGIVSIIGVIKTGRVQQKTEEVHNLVNSRAEKQDQKIDMLQRMIAMKQIELDSNEKTRLALANATAPISVPHVAVVEKPVVITDSHGTPLVIESEKGKI